jgi:hypothetical protein
MRRPVGWIPEQRERQMIDGIRELAPPWIAELAEDDWRTRPRALHEATYREIDRIPRQRDRERVWEVWREIGGSTVSFDELARRLVRFLVGSSETVPRSVEEESRNIDVGEPNHR